MMSSSRISRAGRIVFLASLAFVFAMGAAAQEPVNVRLLGRLPGLYFPVDGAGHYAYVGWGQIYHSYRSGWLDVVDVSDPTSPVCVGHIALPDVVERIRVKDGLAYIAADYKGLLIIDVTNPTSPTLRGSYDTPNYATGLAISGGLAFIADGASLQIIDVTNPTSPTLRGSFATPGGVEDVFVSDGLAFLAHDGLQIVDVANPSSPVLRSSWGSGIRYVFVSNGVAYVSATYGQGTPYAYGMFYSIDVTSPTAPRLLASYGEDGGAGPVYVSGRFAYLGIGTGLHIFDISNPSSPRLCGYYYHAGGDLFVKGSLVYAAGGDLLIFQFSGAAAANRWQLYR